MVALSVFLILLAALLLGFLFSPLLLYVDSSEQRYEVSHFPALHLSYKWVNGPKFRFRVAGLVIPIKGKKKSIEPKVQQRKNRKSKFHRSTTAWRQFVFSILTSFKIRKLVLDVDTDDVITNAQLVPIFMLASRGPVHLTSNYQGRLYLHLEVSNTPARLLWIFVQFLIKK